MKKSKILIIVSSIFVVSIFVSCFLIYNSIFPKAPPIESPHPDTVLSFEVKDYSDISYSVSLLSFYDVLLDAEPTRIMSVNDYPDTQYYYEINIATESRNYRYFLYTSSGKDYIEMPYVGVYEIKNFKIDNLFR